MSVYKFNEKEYLCESFKMNGMRDVPVILRGRFERMMLETFKSGEDNSEHATPISFEYESGHFLSEDMLYRHSLTVYYAFWDDYEIVMDYIQFLQK